MIVVVVVVLNCQECDSRGIRVYKASALFQSTSPDSTTSRYRLSILSVDGPSLSQDQQSGSHYWTVSVTRRSVATVSDNINVEAELISTLPLSTYSAVEMLHDSALHKFMIDIDIDIQVAQSVCMSVSCESSTSASPTKVGRYCDHRRLSVCLSVR